MKQIVQSLDGCTYPYNGSHKEAQEAQNSFR